MREKGTMTPTLVALIGYGFPTPWGFGEDPS
jgi:hypothetical protein